MRVKITALYAASVRSADIRRRVVADHEELIRRDLRFFHRRPEKGGGGLSAAKVGGEENLIEAVRKAELPQLRHGKAALRVGQQDQPVASPPQPFKRPARARHQLRLTPEREGTEHQRRIVYPCGGYAHALFGELQEVNFSFWLGIALIIISVLIQTRRVSRSSEKNQ